MSTGLELKQSLGLSNFKHVKINRAILSTYKILFVWFDSYKKQMPITNYRIKNFPWVAHIFAGYNLLRGRSKKTIFTPPMAIEDYGGNIKSALIIPVNLAGDRFIKKSEFTKVFESVNNSTVLEMPICQTNNLLEFVTLYDLADQGNISDFTMIWRKDRTRVMGTENTQVKLIDCFISEGDKSVIFGFLTSATELGDKQPSTTIRGSDYIFYDTDKMETKPESNFQLRNNDSKTYEIQIKILNFLDWLDVFEGEKIGPEEMKEILRVSNVQVFSNSPSFHWQGMNYNLSKLDGSIFPTKISNPVWGPRHGDTSGYFLDKHLYGLLRQIKFWINPMASMLNKKLKSRGLL